MALVIATIHGEQVKLIESRTNAEGERVHFVAGRKRTKEVPVSEVVIEAIYGPEREHVIHLPVEAQKENRQATHPVRVLTAV